MAANNIVSFGGNRPQGRYVTLRDEYRNTVNVCRQILLKTLPGSMERLFSRLDDVLYSLADKADSNALQTSYFDAMRELRKQREAIENGFNQRMMDGYDRFWKSGPLIFEQALESSEEDDGLSLVGNDDLEEGLAITSIVSKGENSYYRDLFALGQRFGYLLSGIEVRPEGNPIGPRATCEAFHDALESLEVDIPVKLVIYKQFEYEVMDHLGELYDQVNTTLAKANVLSKLRGTARRTSKRSSGAPGQPGESYAGADQAYQEESDAALEVFSTLQQLLELRRPAKRTVTRDVGHLQVVETEDVLGALSNLQHQGTAIQPQQRPVLDPELIRDNLLELLQLGKSESESEKTISRSDEDAIDVISMLFEFILEDSSLADAMQALLARLQIPMLRVAIMDKSFFSRKGHPARKLLNSMAQAAIGWTEAAGRAPGGLYDQMESVVNRIQSEFEDDISLFEELHAQFSAFIDQEQQSVKVSEERATQVTQGKEQLFQAKQQVATEINKRLANRRGLPEVVLVLIREAWKDVLLLARLRKGEESDEWINGLRLMEQLIWSVEPKQSNTERQELLKAIPVLLKGLRIGLKGISYDEHKMTRLFKELQACHVNCLRGNVAKVVHIPEGPDEAVDAPDENDREVVVEVVLESEPDESTREQARDEFNDMAESLEIGTWLELSEEDGSSNRAKLSWRSAVTGSCLFVNRKGMKVAEVTPHGLAMWLRSGRAKVFEQTDVPLMDRALSAMITALDKTGSKSLKPE